MSWTHIQVKEADTQAGSATSFAITFTVTGAVGSGNCVVGYFIDALSSATVTSITDNQSNTYNIIDNSTTLGTTFLLGNITNGPTTITVHMTGGSGFYILLVDEYHNTSGATISNPIDGHALANSTGTAPTTLTSSSITTANSGDLIWSTGFTNNPKTLTLGSGFTQTFSASTIGGLGWDLLEFEVQSTAGAMTSTMGVTGTGAATAIMGILGIQAPASDVLFSQICL